MSPILQQPQHIHRNMRDMPRDEHRVHPTRVCGVARDLQGEGVGRVHRVPDDATVDLRGLRL